MKFDLHNHSTYSDGLLSVKELILRAKSKDLNGMALTDHDSVFGVDEAYEIAKENGMFLFKGLELSTFYKGQTVHIVALFKNNTPTKAVYDFSKDIIDKRINRAKKMMKNIEDIYNVNVDYDYLFSHGTIITRGNMYQCILHSNPSISPDLISEMVSEKSKAYIPASKLDTVTGLKFLHDNNAITILAHPTLINKEYHEEIISLGFDGIESRYPKNKENDEEYFKKFALKYNLFNSAGSDFHGDTKHADISTCTLNEEEIKPILKLLNIEVNLNEN